MNILNVYPKDVYIVIEFSYQNIEHILTYLDRCVASPDPKNPDFDKAADYVTNNFFKKLDALSEEIKNDFGSNSQKG